MVAELDSCRGEDCLDFGELVLIARDEVEFLGRHGDSLSRLDDGFQRNESVSALCTSTRRRRRDWNRLAWSLLGSCSCMVGILMYH